MTDIVAELNMIAGSRQSDPDDDGHVIAKGVAEIERLRALEAPLRAWLGMQSSANAHALYSAGLTHFNIIPVIPD